jgi:hypothetical protein
MLCVLVRVGVDDGMSVRVDVGVMDGVRLGLGVPV